MKKVLKMMIQIVIVVVVIVAVLLGGFIGYTYATSYKPVAIEVIEVETGDGKITTLQTNKDYKITTFNIGYGALGDEQDFFMDGGKNSGALSEEEVLTNMTAIDQFVESTNSDFVLLQEVDVEGKRSYNINQLDYFREDGYAIAYGINYDVFYVPVPITNPHGRAKSGIATLSHINPTAAARYDFDGEEPFPKGLFDLQRCFTITRYDAPNGKELVIINAHFSAFDKGGQIRVQQLAQMKQVLIDEQELGNYVILGGDFNHELPGTSSDNFTWTDDYPTWCHIMDENFLPANYSWAVDGSAPSIRANNKPYIRGENFLATIDGFAVSDNIEIITVKTHGELDFINSDHNPVELVFKLK